MPSGITHDLRRGSDSLQTVFRKFNKKVRALKLLPPVHGGRAGGWSRFIICKNIGYRQRLCPKLEFEQEWGIPLPVHGEGERGGGSRFIKCKITGYRPRAEMGAKNICIKPQVIQYLYRKTARQKARGMKEQKSPAREILLLPNSRQGRRLFEAQGYFELCGARLKAPP